MTHAIAKIEVVKTSNEFLVYGRCGAIMRADADRNVIYCNLNQDAPEYMRMAKALKAA